MTKFIYYGAAVRADGDLVVDDFPARTVVTPAMRKSAKRAFRNDARSRLLNESAHWHRYSRRMRLDRRKIHGPAAPLPDGVANRRLYVDGYHPPVVQKREPTAFVKAQRKQRSDFEFRGKLVLVGAKRRSVPKRGPQSFRANKARWKRERKARAVLGAQRTRDANEDRRAALVVEERAS